MFREKIGCVVLHITRLTDLQRASIVCRVVAICDCRHVLLGGVSIHRNGVKDESAEEDHPFTSPTGKLSVSKFEPCRRHSIEVCPPSERPVANSHHHVSRHYPGLSSTTLFATVVHDGEIVFERDLPSACAASIPWKQQTHEFGCVRQRSRVGVTL